MAEVDPVILELIARNDRYVANLRNTTRIAEQSLGTQERRVVSLERQFARSGTAIVGTLRTLVGAYAGLAGAREFLRLVDASKQIEAQLRLATRESGNFAQAQEDVRRIAAETRAPLAETAQLYSTFQRTALQLGITQEQSARATETVTKAFQISGATAAEASGGLRQFLQGLQSGALRGEELNSVLENAPRLAKLLADSLGVTVGQLRAMGQEGDLAADKLITALTDRKFTDQIDAEFKELPVTFDQAMQQIENAATITFGAFDRGGGFSQMLANFITDGTQGFEELEHAAVETGIDIRSTFEGLANVFEPLLDAARATFGEIEGEAVSASAEIRKLLSAFDQINSLGRNSLDDWIDQNVWGIRPRDNLTRMFDEAQSRSDQQRRRDLGLTPIRGGIMALEEAARQLVASPAAGGGTVATKPAGRRGPSAESLAARAERERVNAIREEGAKQQELLQLQDDILAARAALATAAEDVARFELQQLGNEQAARLSQLNTEKRIGDLTEEEYNVRAAALAEEIALRRQAVERLRDEAIAERELDLQREQLRQQQDQAALEADALYARAAIADTLEQRRRLDERALAREQEIERALLEQAIAEGKIADAAAARAALADRQAAEGVALGKRNQGALGDYLDATSDPRALAEEAAVREIQNVRAGLAEGLAEQLGTKNQFVKDLFSIFLDQVIFRPLAESLRDIGSQGGGLLGGLFGGAKSLLGIGGIFGSNPGRAGLPPVPWGFPTPPGFDNGGSIRVGGRGGTDNNVLSLNGHPFARVSRGERLDIVPNQRLGAGSAPAVHQTIVLDARYGVMTPQLIEHVNQQAKGFAAEAAARAYGQAMKDAPAALTQRQRYGPR
jgi:tape measure domain-containing protein